MTDYRASVVTSSPHLESGSDFLYLPTFRRNDPCCRTLRLRRDSVYRKISNGKTDMGRMVRLIHYTAQEYLRSVRNSLFSDAHINLARDCLAYMDLDIFGKPCADRLI
jgi:hypothetical protein